MTNRQIAMKEAKLSTSLELEDFLKEHSEKKGWTQCDFGVNEKDEQFFIVVLLRSNNEDVECSFNIETSKIIKQHLKETGALTTYFIQFMNELHSRIATAAAILME